jgi:hypothetical protein
LYEDWYTYFLASNAGSLNSFLRIASVHVRSFISTKAIIHKTVAEADSVFRLWHDHICGLFEQCSKCRFLFLFLEMVVLEEFCSGRGCGLRTSPSSSEIRIDNTKFVSSGMF